MKDWIYSMAKRNRLVERPLRLLLRTARSLRSRGAGQTGSLAVQKIRLKKRGFQNRRHLAKLEIPAGWPDLQMPSLSDWLQQRHWSRGTSYRPTISLILPLSEHSPKSLRATVKSISPQSYPFWTLTILYQPESGQKLARQLMALEKKDRRIRAVPVPAGQTPLASLNRGVAEAAGEYCGVIREGDRLSVDALFQVASVLQATPEADVLYTDEANLDPRANRVESLHFKPGWSPELLLSYNYLGGLSIIRRSMLMEAGGYIADYREAQDWELLLRLSERACHFARVPRCCYMRPTDAGAIPDAAAKSNTHPEFRRAIEDHVRRQDSSARVEICDNGVFRVRWSLSNKPLVSIIIPNKNSPELIRSIVSDLVNRTDYPHKEILIVDNQSTDPEVKEFYREESEAGRIRIVPFDREFNYSAACNAGARAARGDYLLFLNNDMEVISSDWMDELVGWAARPETGIVGTKLLYPDGSLQHTGMVIGLEFVTHIRHKVKNAEWGIFGTPDSYRNYLGVTGACQMVSRSLFEEIGGYDEKYQIAYSDIIFCMQALKRGYRVVYTPYAALTHYEQYTRGDTSPLLDMETMARELRGWNLQEDPYYHPELSATCVDPVPRTLHESTPRQMLYNYIELYDPTEASFVPVRWFHDQDVREAADARAQTFLLPIFNPEAVARDWWEAVRFVLYVLRSSEGIRRRFPRALSEGADGAFCEWLCGEGLREYRLPPEAAPQIRRAFEETPGSFIRQLYSSFRPDLRRQIPTALLPSGHRRLLHWLLCTGRYQYDFRDEQIWWFFLEVSEDPVREFEYTYRTSQDWQRHFPAGLTRFGSAKLLAWAAERHRVDPVLIEEIRSRTSETTLEDLQTAYWAQPHWRSLFPRAFRNPQETAGLLAWIRSESPEIADDVARLTPAAIEAAGPQALGLNLMGNLCYPSGLGESIRSIVRTLKQENVPVSLRDVPAHYSLDSPHRSDFLESEIHDVSLLHIVPDHDAERPFLSTNYTRAGLEPRPEVYRIGYWYWELEDVPEIWKKPAEVLDELWAPTEFIATAFRKALPVKVTRMLPGVQLGTVESIDRAEFGIGEHDFLFVFLFDMKSYMERKNPLGLIKAFQKAFRPDDRAKMIIKVSDGRMNPPELARLTDAAREAGVVLIDKVLTRGKSYGLMNACDCYISLHRSEGLGLTMAEAMLMAKPVIATGYSGNLDFMSKSNSLLVDYDLITIGGSCPEYVHQVYKEHAFWAHPSTEHAAASMRWVYENRDDARALGQKAQQEAQEVLSPTAAGRRMRKRLEEIYQQIRQDDKTIPLESAA